MSEIDDLSQTLLIGLREVTSEIDTSKTWISDDLSSINSTLKDIKRELMILSLPPELRLVQRKYFYYLDRLHEANNQNDKAKAILEEAERIMPDKNNPTLIEIKEEATKLQQKVDTIGRIVGNLEDERAIDMEGGCFDE